MNSIAEFLSHLNELDIKISTDGISLHCNAPKGKLTPNLRTQLAEYKTEIIKFLNQDNLTIRYPEFAKIVPNLKERYQPFPLTDIQQAYWIGRQADFQLGNVSTHTYVEVEKANLDPECLEKAWQRLIEHHEMLRAIVQPDGQQIILPQVPAYKIKIMDLRGKNPEFVTSQLAAIRDRLSHQILPSDQWPLFELQGVQLDEDKLRLCISFDLLISDAWSFEIFLNQLAQLIQNPDIDLPTYQISFRDYVLAEIALRETKLYQRSQEYWHNRLATLPPSPELPLRQNLTTIQHPYFVRRTGQLPTDAWHRLKKRARKANLTTSGVLTAAFAEILTIWSQNPRFTINLTLFNRLPLHPQVNQIVGDFTSLTLLAIENSFQDTFTVRSQRIQKQLWQDLEHRHYSGVQVLRDLARQQERSLEALMPVVFTSTLTHENLTHDTSKPQYSSQTQLGEIVYSISQTPQVYLDHQVYEQEGNLVFNWDAVEEVFPPGLLDDLFAAYSNFLHRLADEDELWQTTTRQLLPDHQIQQRAIINATATPIAESALLHTLFLDQVPRHPHKAAVVTTQRTFTYQELSDRAHSIAQQLQQLGTHPQQLIAIVMQKGWEQVVAALGILISGAAYVPIDPELPRERRWYLLQQAEVRVLLTQSHLDSILDWPEGVQRLFVDTDQAVCSQPLESISTPLDLAYVIYTSGSTGMPKGVAIAHQAVVNTIVDMNRRFHVNADDRFLALSSLSFDLSVYDIFGTLASGGTLIIPDAASNQDPLHWAELIAQHQVTIWNSVPALMQMLVDDHVTHPHVICNSLRLVLLSGDWIPLSLPEAIKSLSLGVEVVSLGGATEAAIWSIFYPISQVDPTWKSIPYGRPLANQSFNVLTETLEPCPTWVVGQLYIGGMGLAQGYWRDEVKTQASFIIHPCTDERLYKTGDLGYYLPDGNIVFVGRSDLQVKVQGYRIELGEIETALEQLSAVKQAVVQAITARHDSQRLIAYIVLYSATVTEAALRQQLQEKLPDYMVPSQLIFLDSLPLTPNGKIDRQALPSVPEIVRLNSQETSISNHAIALQITQVVQSVLNITTISTQTNLLAMGATSVDIIKIANQLEQQFSYRLPIKDLMRLATIDDIAKYYEEHLLTAKPEVSKYLTHTYQPIIELEERQQFKKLRLGLRPVDSDSPKNQLIIPDLSDNLKHNYLTRRSSRQFQQQPIPWEKFSQFLSCWQQSFINGQPKFLYASAGGLYPVQAYLYIKPNRIAGLSAGIYYYHPVEHQLIALQLHKEIERNIHGVQNQLIFDESAFSIFLIGQLAAIAPMYGELSRDFCLIEAGLMTQVLEMSAAESDIGLCQIGACDFERVRNLFALEPSHIYLYCLLGGKIELQDQQINLKTVTNSEDWEEGTL
ncbi:MAG: amino acid adenylation domain-containing protein [Nodularia sp. (in: Bacteria)]|nr:MAG: amino acid adenylation domain-containing protein [Nodularia sp. (in: cyanobacteria)]